MDKIYLDGMELILTHTRNDGKIAPNEKFRIIAISEFRKSRTFLNKEISNKRMEFFYEKKGTGFIDVDATVMNFYQQPHSVQCDFIKDMINSNYRLLELIEEQIK